MKRLTLALSLAVSMWACGDSKNASLTSPTPALAPMMPSTHTISGVVSGVPRGVAWTPETGAPVEGVMVEETNSHQNAITDTKGMFSIAGVSGPLSFSVSKSGYFDRHSSTIPADATYVLLRIDPIPATYTLTGAVFETTSSGGRVPVEGVLIEGSICDDPSYCKQQISTTDRNGFYSLRLYEGLNNLTVSKEGYQTEPPFLPNCEGCNATVTLNGDTQFDIQLVRR
jgi:hypothetical protein